jgi:hypothetical protein
VGHPRGARWSPPLRLGCTGGRGDGDSVGIFFPGVLRGRRQRRVLCLHLVEADMRAWKECAAFDPGCVKTLRGIPAPRILRLVVTLRAKKCKNSSAARHYDQISFSFSHSLDPERRSSANFFCTQKLFTHLVGAQRNRWRHDQAERLGGRLMTNDRTPGAATDHWLLLAASSLIWVHQEVGGAMASGEKSVGRPSMLRMFFRPQYFRRLLIPRAVQ